MQNISVNKSSDSQEIGIAKFKKRTIFEDA